MAVGAWKFAKVYPYTKGSTKSGVISGYAINAKTTLGYLKDAIVGFGGWTWNDDMAYISKDGTEATDFITYYTTLIHDNGAKLWIAYSASGCQLHHTCFASLQCGTYSTGPQVTLSDSTKIVSGGWGGGFMMSLIPPGSSNNFSAPNSTDNTWMPPDATQIVAHLGVYNQNYTGTTTLSTNARTISSLTEIDIFGQDDCFLVAVFGLQFGTLTAGYNAGYPAMSLYITGRIFESVSPLDNRYYSKYGWWSFAVSTRDSMAQPVYGINRNNTDVRPSTIYNGFVNTTLPTTQTNAGANTGTPGFFKADGSKFNLNGPNGYFFSAPAQLVSDNAGWVYDDYNESLWSAITVGIYCPSFTNNQGVTSHSGFKGVIRSDMIRSYGLLSSAVWTSNSIPPRGMFIKDKNFAMGPMMVALPWNPELSDSDCPWCKTTWNGEPVAASMLNLLSEN